MRKIVFNNRKGGVGKTTSAVNIGAALAMEGFAVLLVDLDSQAHATMSLGLHPMDNRCVADFMYEGGEEAIIEARDDGKGLYVIPSSFKLSRIEQEMAQRPETLLNLRRRLNGLEAKFDFIVIDTPPNFGTLTLAAYLACNELIVPMPPHFLALKGLAETKLIADKIKKRNSSLRITGVLLTFFNRNLKHTSAVVREIKKIVPGESLLPPIRNSVRLAEAPSFGKTIFEYAPDSKVAKDYLAAAKAIASIQSCKVAAPGRENKDNGFE